MRETSIIAACLLLVAAFYADQTYGAVPLLPAAEKPYKILMLLPVASTSHRNVFIPLAKGLADRGHQV